MMPQARGWGGTHCDIQLQCELSTSYFHQSVDKNIMSIFQYAINLFLVYAHLIPFMITYVGYGTVEPLLSELMTSCHWPDNKKSWIIEDDLKMTY
jgi:hypothetical protein